jgi:RHS repeat-associated protein
MYSRIRSYGILVLLLLAVLAVVCRDSAPLPTALTCQQSRCVSCERMDSLTSAFNRVLFASGQNHVMGNDIYYPMFSRYLSKAHLLYLRVQDIIDFIDTCQRGKIAIISPGVTTFNIFLDTITRSWPGLGPLSITPKLDLEEGTLYPAGTIFEHAALSDFSDNAHDMVYGIGYPPANTASCNPAFYRYYMDLEDAGAHALRAVATGFHDQCGADLQLALIAPPDSIDADKLVSISGPYTPGQLELGTEPGDTMQMVYGNAVYLSGSSMPVRRVGFFMPDGRFPLYTWAYDTSLTLCSGPLRLNMQIPVAACYLSVLMQARQNAIEDLNEHRKEIRTAFIAQYRHTCLNNARESERLKTEHQREEYHFTLFYYDRAGQLVRTIPPQGVSLLPAGNTTGTPAHTMATKRTYNSLGQLVWEQSPDAGRVHYFYDRYGRMVASQSGRQAQIDSGYIAYSYRLYDAQSRLKEAGQIKLASDLALTDTIAAHSNPAIFPLWMSGGVKSEITRAYYDTRKWPQPYEQKNLRGQVSSITYAEYDNQEHYDHAKHYSYDNHGNIELLVQEYPALEPFNRRYFTEEYEYDLISGNTNKITFQRNREDQWIRRYIYNQDNELLRVETSTDDKVWYEDMEYDYYAHGPLKREVLGNSKVQGTDYAYTIHGFIKGVNSGSLNPSHDLGKDGENVSGIHGFFGRDAFGYNLGYYAHIKGGVLHNDYHPVKANGFEPALIGNYLDSAIATAIYNGNISRQTTALIRTDQSGADVMGHSYRYDYTGRLARAHTFLPGSATMQMNNSWSGESVTAKYKEFYHYDKNGNIKKLNREGHVGAMDELTYNYVSGTNKLAYVNDNVVSGTYADDIDNQKPTNYTYDTDGNLVCDTSEGISKMHWSVYGKVKQVDKSNHDKLYFGYGATGQRIMKESVPHETDSNHIKRTYYVHDAGGNVLAVYTAETDEHGSTVLKLIERHIYGSSRIGILAKEVEIANNNATLHRYPSDSSVTDIDYEGPDSLPAMISYTGEISQPYGERNYELTNHLGNVQVAVSDIKIPVGTDSTLSYYKPDVIAMNDYYSFGMAMPGRQLNMAGYRYGYNMAENDNEARGIGNTQYTEYRLYDTRLALWHTQDAIVKPWESPYASMTGNPIVFSDPEGLNPGGGGIGPPIPWNEDCGEGGGGTTAKSIGKVLDSKKSVTQSAMEFANNYYNMLKLKMPSASQQAFMFGFYNSVVSNAAGGVGRIDASRFGADAKAAEVGMLAGDAFSLVAGATEAGTGAGMAGGAAAAAVSTGGGATPVSIPVATAGGTMVTHGTIMVGTAGKNLILLFAKKISNTSGSNNSPSSSVSARSGSAGGPKEGVYDLGSTLGKYVGHSKNIPNRIIQHFAKKGKLKGSELQNAVYHSMPGSTKLQREVYEQYLIDKYGGVEQLINRRNPMGGRMKLYNSMIDDVIKQYNLPR